MFQAQEAGGVLAISDCNFPTNWTLKTFFGPLENQVRSTILAWKYGSLFKTFIIVFRPILGGETDVPNRHMYVRTISDFDRLLRVPSIPVPCRTSTR